MKHFVQIIIGLVIITFALAQTHAQKVEWMVSDSATGNFRVLSQQPYGTIDTIRFGDFDGDGVTDVFTVAPNGQWLLSYSGTRTYQAFAAADPSRAIDDLRFGDFDGDGKTDVFAVGPGGQWLMSSGGNGNYQQLAADSRFTIDELRFGDFNNDGRTDVFSSDAVGEWWYSSGGTSNWIDLAGDASRFIGSYLFGDIVGDRRTDVFTTSPDGTWFASDGGLGGYQSLAGDGSRTINDLRIGDFDGDLFADVFTVDPNTGQWFISYRGTAGYQAVAADSSRSLSDLRFGDGINDTRLGDFGGDGKTDVFVVKNLPVDVPLSQGNAIKLNGTNQYVFVNGIHEQNQFEFSAEAWIKYNPSGNFPSYTIVSKGDSGTGTIFSVWADDKLAFYPGGLGTNGVAWVFSDTTIPRDKWVHVAVSHGGTDVNFYIDGQPAGSPSVSTNRTINQGKTLSIGNQAGDNAGNSNMFSGEIDEVRVWAGTRSAQQILRYKDRPLPPNEPGLAGYWPLNEVAGSTVLNAYEGAPGLFVNESSSWVSTGIPFTSGNAVSLDGVDDWVFVNGITKHAPFEYSAEAWIKFNPTTSQPSYTILSKGNEGTGTIFSVWSDDKLAFYPGGAGVNWVYSDTAIPRNKWVHVAVVHGGTEVRFYLDGQLIGTSSVSANRVINQGPSLGIGNQAGAGNALVNMFAGEIDEVRVWNDKRTPAEIGANILNTVPSDSQGLVAYYKMDVKGSQTVFDESSNRFHGQVLNGLTRVPSSIINVANTPDPTTGKIANGFVTIGELLSGNNDATYENLYITNVPELGSIYVPGEVVVNVNGDSISGTPGTISVFGITFDVYGISLRNGKLGLDVEIKPPNDFFQWDSADRVFLLIDSSGIQIDGGRIGVQNVYLVRMSVKDAYVELRPSTKEFGGGATFSIPGAGLKGKISPKVISGSYAMKDGLPTSLAVSGVNLGIPLGSDQIKLHTVAMQGENLNDLYNMRLNGQIKITGGPSIPLPGGTLFPISLDTNGTITPSNGNIDITGAVSVLSYEAASANIKFRPSEGTLSVNNAFIDMLVYKPTANVAVKVTNSDPPDVTFSGSFNGELKIPSSIIPGIDTDITIGSADATVEGPNKFSGRAEIKFDPIVADAPPFRICNCLINAGCDSGICSWETIDPPPVELTPGWSFKVGFKFDGANGISVTAGKVQKPELAWETPFVRTQEVDHGTFSFMTNWTRVDKSTSSGVLRPFSVNPLGEPVTTFTIPDGTADVILRITYENPAVTDISATVTKPDQSVIDIHDALFPNFFADDSGFTAINTDTKEAVFYLVDPEPGEYTVTIQESSSLGEFSVEMQIEDEEPFMDLVAVFPVEDEPNEFDILWFGTDNEDDFEVKLFLDRDREGLNGIEITDVEHIVEDDETVIAASINGIAPGWYFPYLTINDGKNAIVHDYANAPIFIANDEHPESITDFEIKPISGGFKVNWIPTGDETVSNHTVLYTTKKEAGDFEHFKVAGPNDTSLTIDGLENGVPVLVSVVAGRENGLQSAAELISRVIPTKGPGETPAVIISDPNTNAIAGLQYLYFAKHYDGDIDQFILPGSTPDTLLEVYTKFGSTYRWELLDAPNGMTVDERTGLISWIPTVDQIGNQSVALGLFDQRFNSELQHIFVQEFSVTVYPTNDLSTLTNDNAFRFVTEPTITAFRGTRYSYTATATFPQSYTVRWDLVQAPEGMDVMDSGELFWDVPDDAISTYISLEAVIDDGITEVIIPQTFFLDVKDLPDSIEPPDTDIDDWSILH